MNAVTIHERTFKFSHRIVEILRLIPNQPETVILKKQLLRAATSIGANIVEAQHSSTKKEFLQYLNIVLRSARESEYWMKLLQETKMIYGDEWSQLLEECLEIAKIIAIIQLKSKTP